MTCFFLEIGQFLSFVVKYASFTRRQVDFWLSLFLTQVLSSFNYLCVFFNPNQTWFEIKWASTRCQVCLVVYASALTKRALCSVKKTRLNKTLTIRPCTNSTMSLERKKVHTVKSMHFVSRARLTSAQNNRTRATESIYVKVFLE